MIKDNIEISSDWFTGESKFIDYEVLDEDYAGVEEENLPPIDVSAMDFSWRLKLNETDEDSASILHKTSSAGISVIGVFNSDRSINTQRVRVVISDVDTVNLTGWTILNNRKYWHELERTDIPVIVSKGTVILQQSLHRS